MNVDHTHKESIPTCGSIRWFSSWPHKLVISLLSFVPLLTYSFFSPSQSYLSLSIQIPVLSVNLVKPPKPKEISRSPNSLCQLLSVLLIWQLIRCSITSLIFFILNNNLKLSSLFNVLCVHILPLWVDQELFQIRTACSAIWYPSQHQRLAVLLEGLHKRICWVDSLINWQKICYWIINC